jgi:hypothetical protein
MDQLALLTNQMSRPAVKKSQIWEYLSRRFFQYFLSANAAEASAVIDEARRKIPEMRLIDEE